MTRREHFENLLASVILGALLGVLILGWATTGHCEEVTLTISPRLALTGPGNPARVTIRLIMKDITEKMYCPGLRWLAPDGTEAYQESDCDPYEDADPRDLRRSSWSRRYAIGVPGEFTFCVNIEKPEHHVLKRLCVVAQIHG